MTNAILPDNTNFSTSAGVPVIRLCVNRAYTRKLRKNDPDWGNFNGTFKREQLNLDQIAQALQAGHAITADLKGYRKGDNFISAQHLGLDFDTGDDYCKLDVLQADAFIANYAAILYTTASHTPEKPRARVLFILDQPVTDPDEYRKYVRTMLRMYSLADEHCKDPVRLWFGAKNCELRIMGKVLPVGLLHDLVEFDDTQTDVTKTTPSTSQGATSRIEYWRNKYPAGTGGNHGQAILLATQLHNDGEPADIIRQELLAFAERVEQVDHREERFDDREARGIADWISKQARQEPAHLRGERTRINGGNGHHPAQTNPDTSNNPIGEWPGGMAPGGMTDAANSDRLVFHFGNRLAYVAEWGWLAWNGKQWERDRAGLAVNYAKHTARRIFGEARAAGDEKAAKALGSWAIQSLNRSRLDNMLYLAQGELSARPEDFDRDSWLLNCPNGVINLRTGELQPHDPAQKLSKIAGTIYDPDALCPRWLDFLSRIMAGDPVMIEYLRRLVGISLTGDVSLQALLFLYGGGANGKSTVLNTILAMLGEYAQQAAPQILMSGDRHPTELADLAGARFVATIEVEEGRHMAEVLVKQLTGGDRIKARFAFRDFFEFEPTHKIWLAANHKPEITGTDYAIWRRVKLIPFDVTISPKEQDPQLLEKLKAELPGILAWAVRGCLAWQREGLDEPAKVTQATAEYKTEMDVIAAFLEENCTVNALASCQAWQLYDAFTAWAKKTGEAPVSQKLFSARMKERGYIAQRSTGGRARYRGLGILTGDEGESC